MSAFHSARIYYINSNERLSGSHGQFTYSIPIPNNSGFDRVCLLQANIPISYYMVSEEEQTFTLTEMGVPITITLPVGNYNVNSFKTVVTSLLNEATQNGWVYNVLYPQSYTAPNIAKFTYTVTNNGLNQPSLSFTNDNYELFGFDAHSTNTFVGGTILSTNVVKFVSESSLYIHSDIVDDGNTNILQEVFNNNAQPLSNAVYQCTDVEGYSKRLRTNQSNAYHFYITSASGRNINLNGVACHFTIVLFKRDDTEQIIKDFVKLSVLQNQ